MIKQIADTAKSTLDVVKPSSASEIEALKRSDDPNLQKAGQLEADTKAKQAEINNFLATIVHKGLVVIPKAVVKRITESFLHQSEETQQSIKNKLEAVKEKGNLSGEIASVPAFAELSERLVYLDQEPDLKALFEDLLVSTVDSSKAEINHPSFVEILKNLNNQEAQHLKELFGSPHIPIPICNIHVKNKASKDQLIQSYVLPPIPYGAITVAQLEHWERLGLISIRFNKVWGDNNLYQYADSLANMRQVQLSQHNPEEFPSNDNPFVERGCLVFTEFGKQFAQAVGIWNCNTHELAVDVPEAENVEFGTRLDR